MGTLTVRIPNVCYMTGCQKGSVTTMKRKGNAPIGRASYLRACKGQKLAPTEAMRAKCYDCMGFYEDGIMDCGCSLCPLYSRMPYKEKSCEH